MKTYVLHVVEEYEIEVRANEVPEGVDVDEWLNKMYNTGEYDECAKYVNGYLDDITEEEE